MQANLQQLDYLTMTPIQVASLPLALAGHDLIAQARTGSGKTAAFGLALLSKLNPKSFAVQAMVLCPTRELADQVTQEIRRLARFEDNIKVLALVGGSTLRNQATSLENGVHIVVGTPGRIMDHMERGYLKLDELATLVLDEADRMLDLGFSRELDAVFAALPKRRQTLLFSATFSDVIRQMAGAILDNPLSIETSPRNTAARSVRQSLVAVDKKKKPELFSHLLRKRRWGQVLVFAKTRKGVEQLVTTLQAQGVAADSIHGDKPQPARLRALERFKAGAVQILVATDVAARGLDIDDLPLVVNFDLPIVAEDYIHRIGRTGRAGASGEALSLVCADEVTQLAAIETLTRQTLPRFEEAGFEPDHRVPLTNTAGQVLKKPKKPKKPKPAASPAPTVRQAAIAKPQARQGRSGARTGGRKIVARTATRRSS